MLSNEEGELGIGIMNDIIVNLEVQDPRDERVLLSAIDLFTRWRAETCLEPSSDVDTDAPEIMVRTAHSGCGAVEKQVIFQERRWAAAFLKIWRAEKRRAD